MVLLRNTIFCFTKYNYKTKIFPLIGINNKSVISKRVIKISLSYMCIKSICQLEVTYRYSSIFSLLTLKRDRCKSNSEQI